MAAYARAIRIVNTPVPCYDRRMTRKVSRPWLEDAARLGGLARAKALTAAERSDAAREASRAKNRRMTKAERSEAARKAVRARWAKAKRSKTDHG